MKTPLESHKACSLRDGADADLVLPVSGAGTDADLTIFCLDSQEMLADPWASYLETFWL